MKFEIFGLNYPYIHVGDHIFAISVLTILREWGDFTTNWWSDEVEEVEYQILGLKLGDLLNGLVNFEHFARAAHGVLGVVAYLENRNSYGDVQWLIREISKKESRWLEKI
mgnify:CR=1 FL=1